MAKRPRRNHGILSKVFCYLVEIIDGVHWRAGSSAAAGRISESILISTTTGDVIKVLTERHRIICPAVHCFRSRKQY